MELIYKKGGSSATYQNIWIWLSLKKAYMLDKLPKTILERVKKYWHGQAHFSLLYVW